MFAIDQDHPLRRLFAGLVEHAFCTKVGMCDPGLTSYLADLLVTFTHVDCLSAIGNATEKSPEKVAAMLAVLLKDRPGSETERDRTLYRHIGDYTLFWAGLYPEQLRSVHRGRSDDVLLDYVSRGKQSYQIVSRLAGEEDALPPSLFRHLSEDFEFCLYGLGLVRRELEQPDRRDRKGGDLLY